MYSIPNKSLLLFNFAGKDASEEFEDVGHGSAARLMLDEFYVGEVNPSIKRLISTTNSLRALDVTENGTLSKPSKKLWYLVMVTLGIVAYIWCGIEA